MQWVFQVYLFFGLRVYEEQEDWMYLLLYKTSDVYAVLGKGAIEERVDTLQLALL